MLAGWIASSAGLEIGYESAVAPAARVALAPHLAAHWASVQTDAAHADPEQEVEDIILRARIPHVEQRVTQIATELLTAHPGLASLELERGAAGGISSVRTATTCACGWAGNRWRPMARGGSSAPPCWPSSWPRWP